MKDAFNIQYGWNTFTTLFTAVGPEYGRIRILGEEFYTPDSTPTRFIRNQTRSRTPESSEMLERNLDEWMGIGLPS
jgi:hypothetical protein